VNQLVCQNSQYQNTKVQCEEFQIEVYDPRLNYYKQGMAVDSITSNSNDEQISIFVPQGETMSIICGLYLVLPAILCAAVTVRNAVFGDVV
jgi:hypothetical protein